MNKLDILLKHIEDELSEYGIAHVALDIDPIEIKVTVDTMTGNYRFNLSLAEMYGPVEPRVEEFLRRIKTYIDNKEP